MTRLLPVGTSSFHTLRLRNEIYVDKTDLIFELASRSSKFFLARPRRFGKSLLVSTLALLFKEGKEEFKGLKIYEKWTDRQYQVLRLDFSKIKNGINQNNFRSKLISFLARAVRQQFGEPAHFTELEDFDDWLSQRLPNSLVILIDEYDAPLTAQLNNRDLFNFIRENLEIFYSFIKSNDQILRFLFITGITKFQNTGIFSELNTLIDITLMPEFKNILGYTPDEIKFYFREYLLRASEIIGLSQEELFSQLVLHYDGYCFDELVSSKLFCPWSVLKFLDFPTAGFKNYWFASGGKSRVVLEYFKTHDLKSPEDYSQPRNISLSRLQSSSSYDSIDPNALLTQGGYLTLKKREGNSFFLGFPNLEVKDSMASLYAEWLLGDQTPESIGFNQIFPMLEEGNTERVIEIFNKLFRSLSYNSTLVRDEESCRAVMQIFLQCQGVFPNIEVVNNRGRSDLEVKTKKFIWIFELKFCRKEDSARALLLKAENQIKEKGYGAQYLNKELILVALVYSQSKREFSQWAQVVPG